jgi:hypothetical protein
MCETFNLQLHGSISCSSADPAVSAANVGNLLERYMIESKISTFLSNVDEMNMLGPFTGSNLDTF